MGPIKSRKSVKKKTKTKKRKQQIANDDDDDQEVKDSGEDDEEVEVEERVIGIDELMIQLTEYCSSPSQSEEERHEICQCLTALNESKSLKDEQLQDESG